MHKYTPPTGGNTTYGHYTACMGDAGLAHGFTCLGLEAGLLPIEVMAALAEGFTYPVPEAETTEWEGQRRREDIKGEPYLRSAENEVSRAVEAGYPVWEQPEADAGEVAA